MTAEETFCDLYDKYGDEFNWRMVPLSDHFFEERLKKELDQEHPLFGKEFWAVARCESNDDVLYVTDENDEDAYYIVHLTYSDIRTTPLSTRRFDNIDEVACFIENRFIEEYL